LGLKVPVGGSFLGLGAMHERIWSCCVVFALAGTQPPRVKAVPQRLALKLS